MGRAERVLVVTPASVGGEWEEQIRRFTRLSLQTLEGSRAERLAAYDRATAPFFTVVNYDAMLTDALEVNERLKPEIIILDEAQTHQELEHQDGAGRQASAEPLRLGAHRQRRSKTASTSCTHSLASLTRVSSDRCSALTVNSMTSTNVAARAATANTSKPCVNASARSCCADATRMSRWNCPTRVERTFLVPLSESQRSAYQAHEARRHASAGPPTAAGPSTTRSASGSCGR